MSELGRIYLTLILAAALACDEDKRPVEERGPLMVVGVPLLGDGYDLDARRMLVELMSLPFDARNISARETIGLYYRLLANKLGHPQLEDSALADLRTGWGDAGIEDCRSELIERVKDWRRRTVRP